MSFRDEHLSVKIYVIFVILTGIIFLLFNFPERHILGVSFYSFVILHIILEHLDVPLPRGQGYVTVSLAIDIAMIIIFGPAAAAWASFTTFFHLKGLRNIGEKFHRMLFNAAQMALSTGIAGHVYLYYGGSIGAVILPQNLFPLMMSFGTFFLVNTVLVTMVLALSQKMSFIGVWVTNIRWAVPNYFAILPLGLLLSVVHDNMGIPGVMLLIIPLMLARQTFIMYMDMRNQYLSTIRALTKAIDAKDHYTHGHSERVARYSVMIGQEIKMPEDLLEKMEYLALMHDIGKIGIPESILNKPGSLSDSEYSVICEHSSVGADIISNIKYIGEFADIVRHHHERADGRGYPDGLQEKDMSLGAKIVSVADAFDAMTTERVYRESMSKQEAAEELIRCSRSQFCEDVVKAFINVLRRQGEIR